MKNIARTHPIFTFLLINFAWTWFFWLGAIPLRAQSNLLLTALVMIGGYGPAIAGILTLGLKQSFVPDLSLKDRRDACCLDGYFWADGLALPGR